MLFFVCMACLVATCQSAGNSAPVDAALRCFEGVTSQPIVAHYNHKKRDNRRATSAACANGNAVARELKWPTDVEYNWLHCSASFFGPIVKANGRGTEPSTQPRNLVLGTKNANDFMGKFENNLANTIRRCRSVAPENWTLTATPRRDSTLPFRASSIWWSVSTPGHSDCVVKEFDVMRRGSVEVGPQDQLLLRQMETACCAPLPHSRGSSSLASGPSALSLAVGSLVGAACAIVTVMTARRRPL